MKRRTLLALAAAAPWSALRAEEGPALEGVRRRGRLEVAVYHAMPPFHDKGAGIDVDIAAALARALGVGLLLRPFVADENMDDDLRNVVWRGHPTGGAPADVMLHVPVERRLMEGNPKVKVFGPYHQERLALARSRAALPELPSLDALEKVAGARIAVPGQSLAGWLLIGAESGRWRERLVTHWKDGTEAAAALARGEVVAAAGTASELESVLGGDARWAIEPLPLPQARHGWAVGCAVRRDAGDLAQALQSALEGLAEGGELKRIFERRHVVWRPA